MTGFHCNKTLVKPKKCKTIKNEFPIMDIKRFIKIHKRNNTRFFHIIQINNIKYKTYLHQQNVNLKTRMIATYDILGVS